MGKKLPIPRNSHIINTSHCEGTEDSDRVVVHEMRCYESEAALVESISEVVVDLVWPKTKVRVAMKNRWSVEIGHLAMKCLVSANVLRSAVEELYHALREDTSYDEESILCKGILHG